MMKNFTITILILLISASCNIAEDMNSDDDLGNHYRYIYDYPQTIIYHKGEKYEGIGLHAVPPIVLNYSFNKRWIIAKNKDMFDNQTRYWIIDKYDDFENISPIDSKTFYTTIDKQGIDLDLIKKADLYVLKRQSDTILKIVMNLSAFGVEADFPNIVATIDFMNDSSHCYKSFYNPAFADSTYFLTDNEINKLFDILNGTDLDELKTKYSIDVIDQPTSTIIIHTTGKKYEIIDYGLMGPLPLKKLYEIVFKYKLPPTQK